MNMPNFLTKFAFVAAAVTAGAGFAAADEFDKKTIVTINEAVQLPNATLQPGTYVVKLFRTDVVNRNTVQFFDKDVEASHHDGSRVSEPEAPSHWTN
jgi:hypothetical protein